jgi:hypothetical protein
MSEGVVFGQSDTPPSSFLQVEEQMLSAERDIALLEHYSPRNFREEVLRLREILERGDAALPRFVYAPGSNLALSRAETQLRLVRDQLDLTSRGADWWWLSELMQARVAELSLELELVRALGRAQVVPLGIKRFPISDEEHQAAACLAEGWLEEKQPEPESVEEQISVASEFLARARQEGLEVPVIERNISSIAAVGGQCLYVQKGARVSRTEAARLWVHEVGAHLRPRIAAQKAPPPFRMGTSQANEDEEGRAVLLEDRAALLGPARKRELATRHLLASAVRESPDCLVAKARDLTARGVPAQLVAAAVCRVCRGGGLAREVIYLTSFVRVSDALKAAPALEHWMTLGRISVAGARVLERNWPRSPAGKGNFSQNQ